MFYLGAIMSSVILVETFAVLTLLIPGSRGCINYYNHHPKSNLLGGALLYFPRKPNRLYVILLPFGGELSRPFPNIQPILGYRTLSGNS